MAVEILEVHTNKQLKEYIFFPEKIFSGDPHWVPPLYGDEWSFHDLKKNSALQYSDTVRLMAYQKGKPVGRIMGIIHHKYNETHEKAARFFNLDCINDQPVAHALINHIEAWALSKGMKKIIGPYGFSDKDPQGLQVEGFEHLPVLATPTNPKYLQTLVENEGYTKEIDCVSYSMPIPQSLPELISKIAHRILSNKNIRLLEFKSKGQLRPYIVPVFRLVNECYAPLFGFVPMTEEEMKKFAAQYLPILDPAFVKIIVDSDNDVVAFVVSMPDMSKGIQRAKGKIFPFGFIHILSSAKKTKQLDLLLGAVKPNYRGKGLTAVLGKSLMETARQRGLETMDSHLILETNSRMCAECENVGGKIYKRYRVYKKML